MGDFLLPVHIDVTAILVGREVGQKRADVEDEQIGDHIRPPKASRKQKRLHDGQNIRNLGS